MRQPRVILIIAIICFIAALFMARLLMLREPQMPPPAEPPPLPAQTAEPPPPNPPPGPKPGPGPEAEAGPGPERAPLLVWPVRMYIPALALDTFIEDTGLDASNTMEVVPDAEIISWLRVSAIPGNEGNAILAGHNKWRGKICPLYELDALAIGDEMEIEYEGGGRQKFKLESVFVYALATAPADQIMDAGGEARVTVITCKAPFNPQTGTSDNRIVATFKEESVFVIPDPPKEPFPARQK